MSKRTLKTGTVRKAYALYWEPRFGTQYHEKCLAEFDRWLERVEQAAYKRGVADGKAKWQAEAWERGRDDEYAYSVERAQMPTNPYVKGSDDE